RVEQRRRVLPPSPGVDDSEVALVAALHRLAHGSRIEDVAVETGDVQVVDAAGVGGRADHRAHVGARGDELAGDMRPQEAVGADAQLGGPNLDPPKVPPYVCSQRAASWSSVPNASAFLHHLIPACRKRSGL